MTLEKIDQEMYFWTKSSDRLPFDLQGAVVVVLCAFFDSSNSLPAPFFHVCYRCVFILLHLSIDFEPPRWGFLSAREKTVASTFILFTPLEITLRVEEARLLSIHVDLLFIRRVSAVALPLA